MSEQYTVMWFGGSKYQVDDGKWINMCTLQRGHLGRPNKLRRNEAEEKTDKGGKKWLEKQGLAMRYSYCEEEGHNSKTHNKNIPPKQKKKIREASGSKRKTKSKAARGKKKVGEALNESNPSIESITVRTRSSKSKNSMDAPIAVRTRGLKSTYNYGKKKEIIVQGQVKRSHTFALFLLMLNCA
ncbi:unnamed protein product [Prunus armeniaca]